MSFLNSNCLNEAAAFVQCRAMDTTGKCAACPAVNFDTIQLSFPADLQQTFMMQMAYASPSSPDFCVNVETNVCAAFPGNACCCENEMSNFVNENIVANLVRLEYH